MTALGARRAFGALLTAAVVLGVASPARADKVLVHQNQNMESQQADTAGPEVASFLEAQGHDVTRSISIGQVLPKDLSGFDSVWMVQVVPLNGPDQTTLVEYVKAGGGLYLSGEREACCAKLNLSLQGVVNRLVPDTTNIGVGGALPPDNFSVATDTWGIATTPNAIPILMTKESGKMQMIPVRNQIYAAKEDIQAAAWTGEGLEEAGGCFVIAMDLSFWIDDFVPDFDRAGFVENVQHFLGSCADRDGDGVSDVGEEEAGTDADDPDSDDDGLCDGYGTVPGSCIAGESPLVDTDDDGLINPLDPDDDGDGIPTSFEVDAQLANPDQDPDDDSDPAWLDIDSDGNNILDSVEGFTDFDGNGIPSIVERGDDPENCDTDQDCEEKQPSTIGCNLETGFCYSAGAPSVGNGSAGAGNGSAGAGNGEPSGESGAPGAGAAASGGSRAAEGGEASNAGGSGTERGDGGEAAGAAARDSGGCGCEVPGRPRGSALILLLGLGLLRRARARTRRHSLGQRITWPER